ncbi:SHOCT domain-containing protein [Kitasatospora sp. NPDC089913]|uniref:SHOCT domain-containing protein n=1 Tax=Kitasatospora sp. NPDC089913 TaxID=3364080 RepID=UPI0038006107
MQSTALLADAYCREGWGPWNGGGPGPWFLLFPLFWLIVLVTVFTVFRRRGFGRRGPWGPPWAGGQWGGPWGGGPGWRGGPPWAGGGTEAPLASLARRYADGEITEEEYRTRRDTLLEHLQGGPDDSKPGQGGTK